MTMVLSAMPRSSSALSNEPTVPSCSTMPSAYSVRAVDALGAAVLGPHVGAEVHPRAVVPDEERLAGLALALDEIDRRGRGLIVDRLHPLAGQRAGVLDGLLADLAPARVHGRVVLVRGLAPEHAAGTEHLTELRVLRVIEQLRLLLGVEMVEVAEELIEAVDGRQVLVAVAEVVLAELAGGVAERLEHFGDGRVFLVQADRGGRHPDLAQAGAKDVLAGDERRPPGRAALLRVVVGEESCLPWRGGRCSACGSPSGPW